MRQIAYTHRNFNICIKYLVTSTHLCWHFPLLITLFITIPINQ